MGIKYQCNNINCNYPGTNRFEMTFNSEAIMDHQNLAVTFCPFCKNQMVSSKLTDHANELADGQMDDCVKGRSPVDVTASGNRPDIL